MGMINLIVNCQYYENYNVGPNGFGEVPYWKPKGGFQFKMPVDSDTVCYADNDVIVQAIKNLVEKQNKTTRQRNGELRKHRKRKRHIH